MDNLQKIKAAFVVAFTAINAWLGLISVPFYILVGLNIFDYITGIVAAPYRKEKIESYKGFRGIAKKMCMWLLVILGMVMDYMITFASANMGIQLSFTCLVAVAVVVWLISNELISILENISDIGVPLPEFLMNLAKLMKDKTQSTIEKS